MREVIVALDFPNKEESIGLLKNLDRVKISRLRNRGLAELGEEFKPYVKIGMELFYSEGARLVREIKDMGYRIFLDLKLHDIPNTVQSAMKVLAGLGVDMCNLHCAGGIKMMRDAKEGLIDGGGEDTLLIGVTQLTSTSEKVLHEEILINRTMEEAVLNYSLNGKLAGLDGVVCSPWEAERIHELCGYQFLTVCPGIRFASQSSNDQVRVATPSKAGEAGCDYIVVGRSITQAEMPYEAYERALLELNGIKL